MASTKKEKDGHPTSTPLYLCKINHSLLLLISQTLAIFVFDFLSLVHSLCTRVFLFFINISYYLSTKKKTLPTFEVTNQASIKGNKKVRTGYTLPKPINILHYKIQYLFTHKQINDDNVKLYQHENNDREEAAKY